MFKSIYEQFPAFSKNVNLRKRNTIVGVYFIYEGIWHFLNRLLLILTTSEFDSRFSIDPEAGVASGVKIVSDRPNSAHNGHLSYVSWEKYVVHYHNPQILDLYSSINIP